MDNKNKPEDRPDSTITIITAVISILILAYIVVSSGKIALPKTQGLFFEILFVLGILVFVLWGILLTAKKRHSRLQRLSAYLNGSVSKFSFIPSFRGVYQGLNFSVTIIPGGKNSPPVINISLFKNSFFKLSIYKEDILSRLGQKIGILREVKINDELFDREFLLFSNKPSEAMLYLNNSSKKEAIRGLFNNGFTVIKIDGKTVSAGKPDRNLNADFESENMQRFLQHLITLANGLRS